MSINQLPFSFKRMDATLIEEHFSSRSGELKMGEHCSSITLEEADFVVIGVSESIGPKANFGRQGAENTFRAFLPYFLNTQATSNLKIHILGEISIPNNSDTLSAQELVPALDKYVLSVLNEYIQPHQIPIVIGGGHNNALPLMQWSSQFHADLAVLNLDAHADCRTTEVRHSGNSFSSALESGILKKYAVLGLHEAYLNPSVLEFFQKYPCTYSLYEDYLDGRSLISDLELFLNSLETNQTLGIEIDMDAISNMPSSAQSPSGWRFDEVRTYIRKIAAMHQNISYLHLTEAAPLNESDDRIVGKALTYLVLDFSTQYCLKRVR
jgi:formiminoglutamase